jgi:hypothetical protein
MSKNRSPIHLERCVDVHMQRLLFTTLGFDTVDAIDLLTYWTSNVYVRALEIMILNKSLLD